MAISTAAALIGSAVIGAGANILGSHSQNKRLDRAADANSQAAQLNYQLGQQSLAQGREIYNTNFNVLSPWVSQGQVALDNYSSLLGLPAAPKMTSPLASTALTPTGPATRSTVIPSVPQPTRPPAPPNALARARLEGAGPDRLPSGAANRTATHSSFSPEAIRSTLSQAAASRTPPAVTPATPAATDGPATPAAVPANAFADFANSAGMKFQLQQGSDAIQNMYAAKGALNSGAAMKALSDYAQGTALNNYFMPYMSMLGGLSAQGAQAGSAIAGVGSNYSNTVANINGNIGQGAMNSANALGNIYAQQGQNSANMWGNLGSSFGQVLGGLSGPKY